MDEKDRSEDKAEKQREETENGQERLNELASRLRETKGVDQDIAMLLAVNWQRVLWGLLVVLLVVWLVGYWRESRAKTLGRLSQTFEQVQGLFDSVITPISNPSEQPAPSEETLKKQKEAEEQTQRMFQDNIVMLEKGEGVYKDLARLYRAAAQIERSEYEAARQHLQQYQVESYLNRLSAGDNPGIDRDSFVRELAALLEMRLLIAEGKADSAGVREKLMKLVEHGKFSNFEALILLFRISSDEASRQQVREAARKFQASHADLAETMKTELGNLGISLS